MIDPLFKSKSGLFLFKPIEFTISMMGNILFAPDKLLGKYIIKETGRDMVLWNGTCQVHEIFSERELVRLKVEHEDAKVLAHPECEENILIHACNTRFFLSVQIASNNFQLN